MEGPKYPDSYTISDVPPSKQTNRICENALNGATLEFCKPHIIEGTANAGYNLPASSWTFKFSEDGRSYYVAASDDANYHAHTGQITSQECAGNRVIVHNDSHRKSRFDLSFQDGGFKYKVDQYLPASHSHLIGSGTFTMKSHHMAKCTEVLLKMGTLEEKPLSECLLQGVRQYTHQLRDTKCHGFNTKKGCKAEPWTVSEREKARMIQTPDLSAKGIEGKKDMASCACASFAANMWADYDEATKQCSLSYKRSTDKPTINVMACPNKYLPISDIDRYQCTKIMCANAEVCWNGHCIDRELGENLAAWISREACMPTGNVCKVKATEDGFTFPLTDDCMQSLQNNMQCRAAMGDCLVVSMQEAKCVQKSALGLCMECMRDIQNTCVKKLTVIQDNALHASLTKLKHGMDKEQEERLQALQHETQSTISMAGKNVVIPDIPFSSISEYCTKETGRYNKQMYNNGCRYTGGGAKGWIEPYTGTPCPPADYPCIVFPCAGSKNCPPMCRSDPPALKDPEHALIEHVSAFDATSPDRHAHMFTNQLI